MRNWHAVGMLVLSSCVLLSGCGYIRGLFGPAGPMRYQQNNASLHDPYYDNQQGPEVVGGRPRDFLEPRPEAVRNRIYSDSLYGR